LILCLSRFDRLDILWLEASNRTSGPAMETDIPSKLDIPDYLICTCTSYKSSELEYTLVCDGDCLIRAECELVA